MVGYHVECIVREKGLTMSMISNSVLRVLAEERINNLHQQAAQRRLAVGARGPQQESMLLRLAISIKHVLFTAPSLDMSGVAEENLRQSNETNLPPEVLRRQEAKRRLYERIEQVTC
jgi:hypothetical protein